MELSAMIGAGVVFVVILVACTYDNFCQDTVVGGCIGGLHYAFASLVIRAEVPFRF